MGIVVVDVSVIVALSVWVSVIVLMKDVDVFRSVSSITINSSSYVDVVVASVAVVDVVVVVGITEMLTGVCCC